MNFLDLYGREIPYSRTCRDYRRLSECCQECHADSAAQLEVAVVDGEPALLCCKLRRYFYPKGYPLEAKWNKLTPEERLLRAIFGEKLDH